MENQKIIVAPLNWGLGHATRCVPIIKLLLAQNIIPIIASDGKALLFLQQEFPELQYIELPSYEISYGKNIRLKLIRQFPKIYNAIRQEKKVIENFVQENDDVVGIISDNRFGVLSTTVTSVYITHQINVLSGITTFFSSYLHQKVIKKFDECWVPDTLSSEFSGKLSLTNKNINTKFIGVLSRFKKANLSQEIDVLVLLSGPEPNRTFLEKKLLLEFKNDGRNIVFVLGNVEKYQKKWQKGTTTFYNYVLSNQLEKLINGSKIVVCRSGYSSIMDLAVLQKRVFFIPTKQQPEQEYLAKYMQDKHIAPFATIAQFSSEKLDAIKKYKGLKAPETVLNSNLFCLFQRK